MPDWLEVAVRTLLAVTALFIITKILGKRQVTQLSLFEYITGITIGNLGAYISLEVESPWYIGVISLIVWVSVSLIIMFLQIRSKSVRDVLDGKATTLIQDGQILEGNLRKEKLALDELLGQLRKKNVFRVADVEFASIEPNGALSVLLKQEHRPLTARILGLDVVPDKEPQNIVMDGAILDIPLKESGFTKEDLDKELEKRGATLDEVFLAQVDSAGKLYIDFHDEKTTVEQRKNNQTEESSDLQALHKCQRDFQHLMGQAKDEEAKKLYQGLIHDVKFAIEREKRNSS